MEDVLRGGLEQLTPLFSSDVAMACLFDESRGELTLHRPSSHGTPADWMGSGSAIFVDDPEFARTASGSRQPVTSSRVGLDAQLPKFYRTLFGGLALESIMAVPLIARGSALGELILGSRTVDRFSDFDLQLLGTAAASLAAAMDKCALAGQTDMSLRLRLDQMAAIARVSRELSAVRSIDELLEYHTRRGGAGHCGRLRVRLAPGS